MKTIKIKTLITAIIGLTAINAHAEDNSASEIAKKLSNPIAAMISVPFQGNFDQNMGALGNVRKILHEYPARYSFFN